MGSVIDRSPNIHFEPQPISCGSSVIEIAVKGLQSSDTFYQCIIPQDVVVSRLNITQYKDFSQDIVVL